MEKRKEEEIQSEWNRNCFSLYLSLRGLEKQESEDLFFKFLKEKMGIKRKFLDTAFKLVLSS